MTTKHEYMVELARSLLDELSPDIDQNGNPDRDMNLFTVLEYFIEEASE